MKFTTADLKEDRQWRAATGLSEKQFYLLLPAFKTAYVQTYHEELARRKVEVNIRYCIQSEEDLLLFTLLSIKSGLTYDVLGVVCGMNGSNAKRNQKIGLDILAKALTELGVMPRRKLLTVRDFNEFFKEEKELILDATEQRIQRPGTPGQQQAVYSGKKKPTR